MEEKNFMTPEGYNKTKERLNYLLTVKRQEVANKIAEARSYGDLSENSEYDIARDEQASVETEIFELENKLKLNNIELKACYDIIKELLYKNEKIETILKDKLGIEILDDKNNNINHLHK